MAHSGSSVRGGEAPGVHAFGVFDLSADPGDHLAAADRVSNPSLGPEDPVDRSADIAVAGVPGDGAGLTGQRQRGALGDDRGKRVPVLSLAVLHGPEVNARNVELGTIPVDHACGRIERSGGSASARQLDSQRHSL